MTVIRDELKEKHNIICEKYIEKIFDIKYIRHEQLNAGDGTLYKLNDKYMVVCSLLIAEYPKVVLTFAYKLETLEDVLKFNIRYFEFWDIDLQVILSEAEANTPEILNKVKMLVNNFYGLGMKGSKAYEFKDDSLIECGIPRSLDYVLPTCFVKNYKGRDTKQQWYPSRP